MSASNSRKLCQILVWLMAAIVFQTNAALATDTKEQQEKTALAKEIFLAVGQDRIVEAYIPIFIDSMEPILKNQKGKQLKDKEIDAIKVATAKVAKENIYLLYDSFAELYVNEFSLDELKSILAFYKSPIGTHLVRFQPEMMQQAAVLAKRWASKLEPKIGREINRILKQKKT